MKICTKCKIEKPKSEFYLRDGGRYVESACKICIGVKLKAYYARPEVKVARQRTRKRWRAANPTKVKQSDVDRKMRKYELTIVQFDALLQSQRGVCAICKDKLKAQGRGGLAIDHVHGTSPVVVRGLLCAPCNIALGFFRDSPDILRAAIEYLQPAVAWDCNVGSTG